MKTKETRDLVPLETLTDAAARKRYWRSPEELSDSPEFQELLHTEFPPNATEFLDEVSRRRFLQLAAASLGLAGLTACTRQPPEKILPYVNPPENAIPGHPLYFATAVQAGCRYWRWLPNAAPGGNSARMHNDLRSLPEV